MDKKKAAAVAAVTTVAAAGMVTGALFESPAELLNQPEPDDIVEFMDEDGEETEQGGKQRVAPSARLRGWILSLPEAVRMLVVVPLWVIGWVLLNAVSVFWMGAGPVVERVASWLLSQI